MAVYTHLTPNDLAALLARYDLGALKSCEGIEEGIENTNYKLGTERGRFVLTIFERRVAEADLPFFMAMMEHLAARGFPAPRPQATRGGGFLAETRGKPCAIVSFLEGQWPREPSIAHCKTIGEALARMHLALADFKPTRENSLGPQAWRTLIEPRLALAEKLRPGLAADIARDLDETLARWPSSLPRGAIHADLFPDNALFVGGVLHGVIDFYFACTDFLAYDIAVCLNAWCFDAEKTSNRDKAAALIDAYDALRPLSQAERDALPTLARGAALRFFATRLADWAETPSDALVRPKDPLDYADKLAFHRTLKAATDYGL